MHPILTGSVLDLSPLAAGSVLTITHPDGRMTEHPAVEGSVTLQAPGTYALGVLPPDGRPYASPTVTLEPTPQQRLAAWRAAQVLDRDDFAIAAWQAGHISQADAEAWATGSSTPQIILDALATLPAAQRARWRLKMRGTLRVRRASPEFEFLRNFMGLTEAQGDALFGWTA